MTSALVARVVVVAIGGVSLSMTVGTTHATSQVASSAASGSVASPDLRVSESYGFEVREGFAPGSLEGQAGWTISPASTAEPHIGTANPRSGTQHVRISSDPAIEATVWTTAFSPWVHDAVADASSLSVWVAIGATGGGEYGVLLNESNVSPTAEVVFDDDGRILARGEAGCCFDTGFDWTPGAYVQLVIDVDPVSDAITYWYGGIQVYSSTVSHGTVISQVVISRYNVQSGEHGDFDDMVIDRGSVVPPVLHHWSFTTDGSDSVGGADAVLHNGAAVSGGALVLDGVDDYAELPIAATLSALTDVSVEMWVTWTGASAWERIFDFGTGTTVNWFMTPYASQTGGMRVAITTAGNAGEQRTDAPEPFPLSRRTHVVFTLDGDGASDQAKLYIDGSLVATHSEASALDPAELGVLTNIWLGRSQYAADAYYAGSIDELIIYQGVLGDPQVLESYLSIFADGFESGDASVWSAATP